MRLSLDERTSDKIVVKRATAVTGPARVNYNTYYKIGVGNVNVNVPSDSGETTYISQSVPLTTCIPARLTSPPHLLSTSAHLLPAARSRPRRPNQTKPNQTKTYRTHGRPSAPLVKVRRRPRPQVVPVQTRADGARQGLRAPGLLRGRGRQRLLPAGDGLPTGEKTTKCGGIK